MQTKQVRHYSEVKDKILNAVNTITDPIKQTMGPRGGNVIFEGPDGGVRVTNDGVTIAKNILVKDSFENAIIQLIKQASLKTNTQAGDGTSTTILWSSILIKEGLKLVEEGYNQRDVVEAYRVFMREMHTEIEKLKKDVKNDDDLLAICKVSANNDEEIARHAVQVVRKAGADGQIFLEPSNTSQTEITEDTGFVIYSGLYSPELITTPMGTADYDEVPVLVTDKQLYYAQEAETILNTVLNAGYKEVVIIAKDIVGEALPYFIANHKKGVVKTMLVKDPNVEKAKGATLEDLACYLDGEVISEKQGKIVDRLEIGSFAMAKKAYADGGQTVLVRYEDDSDKRLKERVKHLKAEIKKHGDDDNPEKTELKKRLASLTNGVVTVRIGGSTPVEVAERRYRYEDSISAGRAAVANGYLLGGGVSMLRAYQKANRAQDSEFNKVFEKVAQANLTQIAQNAGAHAPSIVKDVLNLNAKMGYDAMTGQYIDMKEAGILDPYKVTEMAITNAVSIATAVVGSRYLVVNDENENGESRNEGKD